MSDSVFSVGRNPGSAGSKLPAMARADQLFPWLEYLRSAGAPVERLLDDAGFSDQDFENPNCWVPLSTGFRFLGNACHDLGTEHLGLSRSFDASLEYYGFFGRLLENSLTLHDFLRKCTAFYAMVTTGQRAFLTRQRSAYKFHINVTGLPALGEYQTHLDWLGIVIAHCRLVLGRQWSPDVVSIAFQPREQLPANEIFADSLLISGTGETYITVCESDVHRPFIRNSTGLAVIEEPADNLTPEDRFCARTYSITAALLVEGRASLTNVSDSLGYSSRSLQRRLQGQGLSYAHLLAEARLRKAGELLSTTDAAVTDIAAELGYSQPANFSRAFQKQTGIPPTMFRASLRT